MVLLLIERLFYSSFSFLPGTSGYTCITNYISDLIFFPLLLSSARSLRMTFSLSPFSPLKFQPSLYYTRQTTSSLRELEYSTFERINRPDHQHSFDNRETGRERTRLFDVSVNSQAHTQHTHIFEGEKDRYFVPL